MQCSHEATIEWFTSGAYTILPRSPQLKNIKPWTLEPPTRFVWHLHLMLHSITQWFQIQCCYWCQRWYLQCCWDAWKRLLEEEQTHPHQMPLRENVDNGDRTRLTQHFEGPKIGESSRLNIFNRCASSSGCRCDKSNILHSKPWEPWR